MGINVMSVDYKLGHVDEILSKVRMRGGNAAKRAYVMLKAKSELWNNLSFIKEFPIDHISKSVNLAYFFCNKGFRLIENISNVVKNKEVIEFISKVLYFIPYIIFRLKRR